MSTNSTVLEGIVASCDAPRTTPGGTATRSLTLKHESIQQEGDREVTVEVEMNAVAFGEVAKALGSVKVGDKLSVKGFLSRKSRYSSFPILHITQFKHSS